MIFATPIGIEGKDPKEVFDFETYDALRTAEKPRK